LDAWLEKQLVYPVSTISQSEQELAATPMVIFLSHVIAKFPFSLVTNLRNLSRMISSIAVSAMQVLFTHFPQNSVIGRYIFLNREFLSF